MANNVSMEQKLQLAQVLRQENNMNRQKIRQRESIIYGKQIHPTEYQDTTYYDENGQLQQAQEQQGEYKVFLPIRIRILMAAFLFVGIVVFQKGDFKQADEYMGVLKNYVTQDYTKEVMNFMEEFELPDSL